MKPPASPSHSGHHARLAFKLQTHSNALPSIAIHCHPLQSKLPIPTCLGVSLSVHQKHPHASERRVQSRLCDLVKSTVAPWERFGGLGQPPARLQSHTWVRKNPQEYICPKSILVHSKKIQMIQFVKKKNKNKLFLIYPGMLAATYWLLGNVASSCPRTKHEWWISKTIRLQIMCESWNLKHEQDWKGVLTQQEGHQASFQG